MTTIPRKARCCNGLTSCSVNGFLLKPVAIFIPLTLKAHGTAESFYQRHSDPQKAKQVYLNTLAIEAVHSYLSWLGVGTDRQSSDSWNPFVQTLADVADLEIPGQGKLECRLVLPGATACHVPLAVWGDRLGYVVVRLEAASVCP
jgi:Protein of unknown function (DUF1822)